MTKKVLPVTVQIARIYQDARISCGLTHAALADRLDTSESTVKAMQNADRNTGDLIGRALLDPEYGPALLTLFADAHGLAVSQRDGDLEAVRPSYPSQAMCELGEAIRLIGEIHKDGVVDGRDDSKLARVESILRHHADENAEARAAVKTHGPLSTQRVH